jgi:hypothetical protein
MASMRPVGIRVSNTGRSKTLLSSPKLPLTSYTKGVGVLPPGVKGSGREVDHSSPSSVEIKNMWNHISTLVISLHGVEGAINKNSKG